MSFVPNRPPLFAALRSWLPPLLISAFLWWLSPNTVSWREAALAAVLLLFPWSAYCRWQRDGRTRIPLFALLSFAYWTAFAMSLFLADPPADPGGVRFGEETVFGTLEMAVVGVAMMGLGMKIPFRPVNPSSLPDVSDSVRAWRYLYCLMALGTVIAMHEDWVGVLGSGGYQLMTALAKIVPIAICAMLATKRIEGTASRDNGIALALFVAARIVIGIASGWMGSVAFMGVILALIHLSKYRKLPVVAILIVIPVILFLQVGKGAFRAVYWAEGKTGGVVEKAQYWLKASFDEWSSVFSGRERRGSQQLFAETLDRLALLPQAANVMAMTPRIVPYRNGASYSYLAATLIPRAVWPDKPSVSEANRDYQIAYGLTAKEDIEGVSISVGCLAEAFMNFGWWGVTGVMLTLGLLLGVFERTLLMPESGLLFCGIGLALISSLLTVEAQAAQYLGGLLQQIAVVVVFVLPVVQRRKVHRPGGFHLPEAA